MSRRFSDLDLIGVRFAINVFVATPLIWLIIRPRGENLIWAISSMIAASEPKVEHALKFFWGRLLNASIGCITGSCVLLVGGSSLWKIPLALSVSVLISNYVVHVPVMWRQAPITAAIVVAGGVMDASKTNGLQLGLIRVTDVLLGCGVGLLVTFVAATLWPLAEAEPELVPGGRQHADEGA